MKLSKIAILALRGAKDARKKLSKALQVSEQSIGLYLKNNDDALTKAAAMEVIREITGLSDVQILETAKIGV